MRKATLFLVSVALVVLSVVAADVSPSCKGDEESWCHSLLLAKRCGVVDYCQAKVWASYKPKTAPCNDGGVFVKKAQVKTMHIISKAAKLDTMAGLCHDLDPQAMALCKSVMVEAGPEALQLINSTMVPPVFIGSILGLCADQIQPQPAPMQPEPQQKDIKICVDCKAFLKDIEGGFIGPDIQEKMKLRMETVCAEVPDAFYNMCKQMSDDWIKHFFAYMNEEMQLDRVCDLFLPCRGSEQIKSFSVSDFFEKMKSFSTPLSDVTCKTCKQVMEDVKNYISTPTFQAEAEDFMAATVCNLMPHHMIHECKHRIMRYGNLIFDIIIAGFDSQTTCEAVRMCHATTEGLKVSGIRERIMDMIKRMIHRFLPDSNMLPLFELFGSTLGGTECSLCQLLVKEVERVIADDKSESQITSAMYEACNLLPDPWQKECIRFVQMNGRKLIEDILHNFPPREICFSFGFCDDDAAVRNKRDTTIYVISEDDKKAESDKKPQVPKENSDAASSHGGSAWCLICNEIAGIVQRLLASQQLNLGVDTIYQQVCAVFPHTIASRCSRLSKHMIDGVLGGMSSVAQPQLICGAIGVCDMTLTPMNYSVNLPDVLKPPYH